jgi:hypothetical protein
MIAVDGRSQLPWKVGQFTAAVPAHFVPGEEAEVARPAP